MDTPQPFQREFSFPTPLRALMWVGVVFFTGMTILCVLQPSLEPNNPMNAGARLACACIFLFSGGSSAAMVRYLRSKVEVDDREISRVAAGGERDALRWSDVARIRERPLLQRLELHSLDSAVVIKLDYPLEQFEELRRIVMEYTDWERLCSSETDGWAETPELPVTIYKTRMHLPFVALLAGFFATLAVASWVQGVVLGGIFFTAFPVVFGFLLLCDWRSMTVDADAITVRYPFGWKRVPIEEVESVELANQYLQSFTSISTVYVSMRNGKRLRLVGARGGSLQLYKAVLAGCPTLGVDGSQ